MSMSRFNKFIMAFTAKHVKNPRKKAIKEFLSTLNILLIFIISSLISLIVIKF